MSHTWCARKTANICLPRGMTRRAFLLVSHNRSGINLPKSAIIPKAIAISLSLSYSLPLARSLAQYLALSIDSCRARSFETLSLGPSRSRAPQTLSLDACRARASETLSLDPCRARAISRVRVKFSGHEKIYAPWEIFLKRIDRHNRCIPGYVVT